MAAGTPRHDISMEKSEKEREMMEMNAQHAQKSSSQARI